MPALGVSPRSKTSFGCTAYTAEPAALARQDGWKPSTSLAYADDCIAASVLDVLNMLSAPTTTGEI